MNSPRPKYAVTVLVTLVTSISVVTVYSQTHAVPDVSVTDDQKSTSDVPPAPRDVPRPASKASAGDPGSLASTIIFPDGEVVSIKWWAGQRPHYARFPYDEKFLELLELARVGDVHAAFSAFGILDSCASTLDSGLDTEMRIDSLRKAVQEHQQGSLEDNELMSSADLERQIDSMRSSDAACRRIDASEIVNRERLLRQAANGGVIVAMNWLGSSTSDHDEAVEILEKSWTAGSYRALEHLAWRYQQSYATFHRHHDQVLAFSSLYAYATLLENGQTLRGHEANILTTRAWDDVDGYARFLDNETNREAILFAKSKIKNNSSCCTTQ